MDQVVIKKIYYYEYDYEYILLLYIYICDIEWSLYVWQCNIPIVM